MAARAPEMPRVKDLATIDSILKVPRSASIAEAAKIMTENNVGSLIVVDDNGHVVGIVTERDILDACAKGYNPTTTRVDDIMSRDLITIKADALIADAVYEMVRNNIRHLPVVDENGQLIGVLSMRDAMRGLIGLMAKIMELRSRHQLGTS